MLSGSRNFFESGHGKGSPDAIGGVLERKADQYVNHDGDTQDSFCLYTTMLDSSLLLKCSTLAEMLLEK